MVLNAEDLEWSVDDVLVQALVRSRDPLTIKLEASKGILRRASVRQTLDRDQE